jgi:hypothetical protein
MTWLLAANFLHLAHQAKELDWDRERGIGYLFGLRIAAHGVDLGFLCIDIAAWPVSD